MTTREASLKFPKTFNDSTPIPDSVREKFEGIILTWFGGFTVREVIGQWVNDKGQVFKDSLLEYDIAMENTDENILNFRNMAEFIKKDCKQEAVYCRLPSGDVEFI